ncbi:MAG TPA: hypothetical protein VF607_02135 [Verrucomicrobiae bacterium]
MATILKPARTRSRGWRIFWYTSGVLALLLAILAGLVIHRLHQLPPEFMLDIKAGMAARGIQDADQRFEKYLEGRYGPQTNAANRDKVFLDFFNLEHIRAMQMMVKHSPVAQRQANIDATARWVQKYRNSLTDDQKEKLRQQLLSDDGKALLKNATTQYNQQDVQYRGQTAPVISQLLTTIAQLQRK